MTETTPRLARARSLDVRTVTGWTIVFMVLLRVAIGWHFFYEGVWKIKEGDKFSSAPYLQASIGPMGWFFREVMVQDPYGKDRIQPERLKERIDARVELIKEHYGLNAEQYKALTEFAKFKKSGDPANPQDQDYVDAIAANQDFQAQRQSYDELVKDFQKRDRQWWNVPAYLTERTNYDRTKIWSLRAELIGRAEAPLRAVETFATSQLNPEQLGKGPLPREKSPTWLLDQMTMWGLTLVGACLVIGLFTRFAAVIAASFLVMFYISMPPLPGYPPVGPVEGHYLFVNKNLIELFAVLMLATSRIGRWFGLDGILHAIFGRKAEVHYVPVPVEAEPVRGNGSRDPSLAPLAR